MKLTFQIHIDVTLFFYLISASIVLFHREYAIVSCRIFLYVSFRKFIVVRRLNVGHVCCHQVPAREYELQALQIERRRNEELERKLAEEVHRREELIEEQIRLRDRRKLQVCVVLCVLYCVVIPDLFF